MVVFDAVVHHNLTKPVLETEIGAAISILQTESITVEELGPKTIEDEAIESRKRRWMVWFRDDQYDAELRRTPIGIRRDEDRDLPIIMVGRYAVS